MRRICLFVAVMALVFSGCDFTEETITGLPGNPQAIATGDFDGNGMPDAVLGFGTDVSGVALAMQGEYGFWSHKPVSNLLFGGSDLLGVTDANDDGSPDIVVGGTASGFLSLLRNNGDATFASTTALLPDGASLTAIVTGKSSSGRQLVLARYKDSGDVTRYGTFEAEDGGLEVRQTAWTPSTSIDADAKLRLADLHGDGTLDLAAGNDNGNIEIFRGSGVSFGDFGTTSNETLSSPGAGAVTAFAIGDAGTPPDLQNWSDDGLPDVLVGYSSSPIVYGWRGQSGGGFALGVALGTDQFGSAPLTVANIEIVGANGAWGTNVADADGNGGAIGFIADDFSSSGYFQSTGCTGPAQSVIQTPGDVNGINVPGIVLACRTGNQAEYVAYQRGRLKVTAAPSDFGEQLVGTQSAAQALTVDAVDRYFTDYSLENKVNVSEWRVEGDDAEDFTVTGSTGDCPTFVMNDLPPNTYHFNNCSAQVKFTPHSPGAKSARLVIVNDGLKAAGAPHQSVELNGFATSKILWVTDSIDAGWVADNRSVPFTVRNDGNRAISLNSFAISPAVAGWSASAGTCGSTLAAGASCQASVTFGGGEPRVSTAQLVISGDQQGGPTTVNLSAQKVTGTVVGEDLNFGEVQVSEASSLITTLINDDEIPLAFDELAIEGPDAARFSIVSEDCTDALVPQRTSCSATIAVAPTARGPLSATLRASSDSTGGDELIELDATGIQGVLSATVNELTFDAVTVGSTSDRSLVVKNEGDSRLKFASIAAGGPFVVDGNCSNATLPVGQVCQIALRFRPTTPGQFSTVLTIPNDGVGGVRKVVLRGLAEVEPLPPPPPTIRKARPRLGVRSVRIAPNGSSVRVALSVAARGGSIDDATVKIRLPRVMRWRPMSADRDARRVSRGTVTVRLGGLRAGSRRAFAVRLFSSRDLRDWRTSIKAVANSDQGSDSLRFTVSD